MHHAILPAASRGRKCPRMLVALGLTIPSILGLSACEDLLEVELPTRVPAETLEDPALAGVAVESAIADFECAFANYVIATGLLADELYISTEFIEPTNWDLRRITPDNNNLGTAGCTSFGFGVYQPLSTARYMADYALNQIEPYSDAEVPDRTVLLATAAAYAGYSYTVLGEGFCSVAIDGGPELQPDQVLALAEERFARAIQLAETAGNSEILNMARVGRARVRLNLGKTAEAMADAQLVPEGFVKYATYGSVSERRENYVYTYNHRDLMVSVDPEFRNLQVDGVADSRVPVMDADRLGHDGITPLWLQLKYTSVESPIVLASWKEAQLILAEAGGGQTAIDAINRLRGRAGLPSFGGGGAEEIAAQVIEERSRELYLEGHRLNDMLRHDLPFPSGVDHKGRPYGSTTCLPLPQAERDNNPNV